MNKFTKDDIENGIARIGLTNELVGLCQQYISLGGDEVQAYKFCVISLERENELLKQMIALYKMKK